VVQLHQQIDRIHAAGAELVIIGNGAPNFIAGFREHTHYQGPLYTDPSLKVYKAAQLKRGVATLMSPKLIGNALRAVSRGHMQGRTQGDATQQGGVLVVLPPGRVAFAHVSDVAGDNAPADQVVAALERAVRAAA
jgi:hypothetical protein